MVLNIAIVAFAVFHHGGRNAIFVMIISYILAFLVLRKKIAFTKRLKRILVGLGVVAIVLIFVISASRGIDEVMLSLYAYLVASIPLGQIYLSDSFVASQLTMGFFSLQGFFYPVVSVLNWIGIDSPDGYLQAVAVGNIIESNYVSIGDYTATGTNAFLPAGAYAYVDGGWLGEVLGMALYGFLGMYIYNLQESGRDPKHQALYVLWGYGLVLSFCRLYFASYGYAVGLLILLCILYRRNNSAREDHSAVRGINR